MKIGDDDPKTIGQALTALPSKPSPSYEVGYRKPPTESRFRSGQSGNPKGRPKGSKNKPVNLASERFKEIILEEAYRGVTIHDGNRQVTVPIAQAIVRSLAVNAAKGNARAQRLFAEMLVGTEATNRRLHDQMFEAALDYKIQWERELERRRHLDLDLPPPIPHPDHVRLDFNTGSVRFAGPMTKEEKAEREAWLEQRPMFEKEIKVLERDLRRARDPARRKSLEADIKQAKTVLGVLGAIEESLSVFGR